MGRNSVAVLDVRSSEVAVFVGERGVNNTFQFSAGKSEPYDGYGEGAFFDVKAFSEAVFRALSAVEQICGQPIHSLWIGVPGEFCDLVTKEREISFPKRKKISERDLDNLFAGGREERKGYRFIRATSMIFVTADNRRVVDPIGLSSTSLYGVLSYFYCTDYFVKVMEDMFSKSRIRLYFLPTQLAMADYLIPSETRDECALFLDVGYLSSTAMALLGGGALKQETFWAGRGQIAARIMEKFSVPYDVASMLLSKVNLNAKGPLRPAEYLFRNQSYMIDPVLLAETVKEGLDDLCEVLSGFLDECQERELEYKPLFVSGEGLADIRGALEHIGKRVNRVCEMLVPDLPFYNKPAMSSRIALVGMAYDDRRKAGLFNRLFNGFGGNK